MTTKPRLRLGGHLLPGLAAVALFAVLTFVFLGAEFAAPAAGFEEGVSITASIGYALLDITSEGAVSSEGFLAALFIIAFVLDAALDGAVFLAIREEGGRVTDALRTDGSGERERDGGDR